MTKTQIANIALAKFREGRITNIESTTDPVAVVMNDQYDHALELLLEEHRWNFAGKRVTLTKISDDPPFGWDHQYALPADCIRLKDVNGEDVEASSQAFTLEGRYLLTNDDTVTITYVAKIIDTNFFSPSFAEALAFKLSSLTCGRLTGDTELAIMLDKQYNYALSKAIHNDTKADGSREHNLMQRMLNSSAILGGNNLGSGTSYPRTGGSSSGSVAAHNHELTDLLQTTATNGEKIIWNDTEDKWEAGGAVLDAKGDLATFDATASAESTLAVGSDGQFLKADSSVDSGLVWDNIAGGGDMLGSNNLSDVANAATSRTNLGLGTAATSATGDFAAASHTHVASTDIVAGGTPDATTFLRGDDTWTAIGGGGTVDTSGTPVINDFARFTDADTIEGRSYAEVKADLDLEIGTDVQAHSAVLDATTASFLTADETNLDLNTTHRTSDGSDHTFIDQDVTISSSPEFDGINLDAAVSAPAHSEGLMFYDQTNKSLAIYNDEADITLQVGQEEYVRVYNATGAIIDNGKLVYISGANGTFPQVTLAISTSEATSDVIGFATHNIGIAEYGYVTRGGVINGVDTLGYSSGESLYLSDITAGDYSNVAPSLPNYEAHVGHVVVGNSSSGSIFVQVYRNQADREEIVRTFDGMAFDKLDLTVVSSGGLQLDVEKVGGGDVDYLVEGVRTTLDCTTGSGVGGKARVLLTAGTDANTPATNYIYITDTAGTSTLNASTSLPTGAFGWVGKIIVPDATTWATTGEYAIQRYTETFSNVNRGALSHQREKLRALGAVYISGGTQTLTINTGATPDSVHLETAAAEVYQLHRQSFPAFTTGAYYYGNGNSIYEQFANLNLALETSTGTAFTNNNRYNLVVWGAVNLESGDCKLYVNLPNDVYTSDAQAIADTNATADYSVPDDMRSVAFLISRITLQYSTTSGGTFTELGLFSLLGTPLGVRSGGSGAVASSEFGDSTFRILDDTDATKELAFQNSGITTGTTRTLTVPDADGTIALSADITKEIGVACSDETTDLAVLSGAASFRMPYAMTVTDVRASVNTAPTGATIIVDINEGGTSIMTTTKLSIDASEKTSTTAAAAAVITDSILADDAEITIDIDQVGSTLKGKGLKVWIIGTPI